MPLQLVTGYMKYRTDPSDQWRPIVVHTTPESGALLATTAQSFTSAQKQQLYANLDIQEPVCTKAQTFTTEQKEQVCTNLGINNDVLIFDIATLSSLPKTINNASITEDHVAVECMLGNAWAQNGDFVVTTTNGSATINGAIRSNQTTTIRLVLVKANKPAGSSTIIMPVS